MLQSEEDQISDGESSKRQCHSPPEFTPAEKDMLWRLLLEYQAESCLPDSFVESMSFRRLLVFLNARCRSPGVIPHRHVLGGRILNEYADLHSAEQRDTVRAIQTQSGGRVNFLSDVWETVAKEHVLGCMITLFGCTMTYGLRPAGDRHDGLSLAQQMEVVMEELIASGWKLGAVVTDDAGQCARARRILAFRYPGVAYLRCFAHDINNLVKAVLKTVFSQITAAAAGAASYLNTSSSKWLVRAFKAMKKRYGHTYAIFTLCETRWNSMQACFASLLRARGALENMIFTYRNSSELTHKLRVLGDQEFWTKLEMAEKIVRPLCTASFRLQRDENTLGDVVASYMEIYRAFASTELNASLTELVETRWNTCEQPLFILGFFLHPAYIEQARSFPSTVLTDLEDICQFAQYYYRRFISDDDRWLRDEMFSWIVGNYTTSRFVDFKEPAVLAFWEFEKKSKKNDKLPLLAITILSIAVNTATCERLFSELSLILTPKRNRTGIEKALKHHVVRQYVREKNRREKETPVRSKKLLRTVDPKERPCVSTPQNSAATTPARAAPIYSTPVHPTQVRAACTPSLTATDRTTPVHRTTALDRTPARHSRRTRATPYQHAQQLQPASIVRDLLPAFGAISSSSVSQTDLTASREETALFEDMTPAPPSAPIVTTEICSEDCENAADNLAMDLDTVAISSEQLDEYLEQFDWEEIGDYGDEATVGVWSNILNTRRITTSSSGGVESSSVDAEPDATATTGDSSRCANENGTIAGEAGATDDADSTAGNALPFTTTRLGTCADPIPEPNRQPYPRNDDKNFPQEKCLTGIRARKTSLASLVDML